MVAAPGRGVELLVDALDRLIHFRQQHFLQRIGAPFGTPVFAREARQIAGAQTDISGVPVMGGNTPLRSSV